MTCKLLPGDVLYIPSFAWHNVLSSSNEEDQFNIAVNFWFKPNKALETYHSVMHSILLDGTLSRK